MTRRLRYSVAASLDGFIATEDGGYDWIPEDKSIDFESYLAKIDALVMGRGTWEVMQNPESAPLIEMFDVFVVSTTLEDGVDSRMTVIASDVEGAVRDMKAADGKDIWLFGGGVLFRSMLEAGLVDRVEIAVLPVLLGQGIPLLPGLDGIATLILHSTEPFDSGITLMKYDVGAITKAG
jgi:dihydrofolate reductase